MAKMGDNTDMASAERTVYEWTPTPGWLSLDWEGQRQTNGAGVPSAVRPGRVFARHNIRGPLSSTSEAKHHFDVPQPIRIAWSARQKTELNCFPQSQKVWSRNFDCHGSPAALIEARQVSDWLPVQQNFAWMDRRRHLEI